MVPVRVHLPGVLREFAAGATLLEVDLDPAAATAAGLLDDLADRFPALERRIRDEAGALRRHVNVFVGETNLRDAAGLATPIPPGALVHVIPAVSGG